jgi:putative membrane protein
MIVPGSRRVAGLALILVVTPGAAVACASVQAAQTAAAPHHLSARDIDWLNEAHQANETEDQVGQLAETNTSTPGIRSIGAAMNHDHSVLDARLIRLAGQLRVNLVTYLTTQQYTTADRLSKELGFTFGNDFVGSMMTAHQQMIAATEAEIRHGSSPQVVAFARQTLPVLEKDLRMLRAVAGSAS